MPDAAPPRPSAPPPVVLRRDAEFTGLVLLPRTARIDGRVFGAVLASRGVWIGETACVQARIEAEEVVVAGEVRGVVTARRRTELLASGRLHGEVQTPQLAIAEGAVLEGPCRAGAARASDAASS